ncbi:Protein of unknown function [Gryllus bimaculatus]|nr:Protein of unknown function [Gryllus bimaculatus]
MKTAAEVTAARTEGYRYDETGIVDIVNMSMVTPHVATLRMTDGEAGSAHYASLYKLWTDIDCVSSISLNSVNPEDMDVQEQTSHLQHEPEVSALTMNIQLGQLADQPPNLEKAFTFKRMSKYQQKSLETSLTDGHTSSSN